MPELVCGKCSGVFASSAELSSHKRNKHQRVVRVSYDKRGEKHAIERNSQTLLFSCVQDVCASASEGLGITRFQSEDPSLMRAHAKACEDKATTLEQMRLTWLGKWSALVCLDCKSAVNSTRATTHWASMHGAVRPGATSSDVARVMLARQLVAAAPAQLATPSPDTPIITELEWKLVYPCSSSDCDFVANEVLQLKRHQAFQHARTVARLPSPQPITMQRWYPGGTYFPVAQQLQPQLQQPSQPQSSARQKRQLRVQQQQQQTSQAAVAANMSREKPHLDLILQGGDLVALATCVDSGRSSRKSAVEATVREVLQAGCKVLSSVPLFVKKQLATLDDVLDASAVAFSSESDEALLRYADVWSRVMLFLVRAREQLESEEQARADGLLPAWRVLQSLNPEQLASVTNLSSYNEATRRTAVLDVSRFCIEQSLRGEGVDSAIMVTFACLCASTSDARLGAAQASPNITGLLYCSRLFSLLIHLTQSKLWDPKSLAATQLYDDLAAKARCYEAFEDRHYETLSRSSGTAVPRLASLGSPAAADLSIAVAPAALPAGVQNRSSGSSQLASSAVNSSASTNAAAGSSASPRQSGATRASMAFRELAERGIAAQGASRQAWQSQAGPSKYQARAAMGIEEDDPDAREESNRPVQSEAARKRKSTSLSRPASKRRAALSESDDDDLPVFVSVDLASGRSIVSGRRSQETRAEAARSERG